MAARPQASDGAPLAGLLACRSWDESTLVPRCVADQLAGSPAPGRGVPGPVVHGARSVVIHSDKLLPVDAAVRSSQPASHAIQRSAKSSCHGVGHLRCWQWRLASSALLQQGEKDGAEVGAIDVPGTSCEPRSATCPSQMLDRDIALDDCSGSMPAWPRSRAVHDARSGATAGGLCYPGIGGCPSGRFRFVVEVTRSARPGRLPGRRWL
jgi:hypothetical protein